MHWRDVIQNYLVTGVEDSIDGLLRRKERRQPQFLEEAATPELLTRLADWNHRLLEKQRMSYTAMPAPDQYVVVEETNDRVVVEVEEAEFAMRLGIRRFRLLRTADSWRLDEIYRKCVCNEGLCALCKGNTVCPICRGQAKRQRWELRTVTCGMCKGSGRCMHCEGTGRCRHCRESEMPGWKSLTG